MLPLFCAACLLTPAPPGENPFHGFRLPAESAPWSEISGPFPEYNRRLFAERALITVAETWQAGSIPVHLHPRPIAILRKEDGHWRLEKHLPPVTG